MKKRNKVIIIILICLVVIGSLFTYTECKKDQPLEYNAVVLKFGLTSKKIFTSEFMDENDIEIKNYIDWQLIITDQATYDKVFSYDYNVDFNSQMIVAFFYMAWNESSVRIKSISCADETLIITKAEKVNLLESCNRRNNYGTPIPHNLIIKLDKLNITKCKTTKVIEKEIW